MSSSLSCFGFLKDHSLRMAMGVMRVLYDLYETWRETVDKSWTIWWQWCCPYKRGAAGTNIGTFQARAIDDGAEA
jgi:hypothetical protein